MMAFSDEDHRHNHKHQTDTTGHSNMMMSSENSGHDHGNNTKSGGGLTKAEIRKSNKPIMEKKRRARINHCLNELKSLILEAMKKDPARHTKLEKADILEMTVKHLQNIQRQPYGIPSQNDSSIMHKFKSGFADCADEVTRYISQIDSVDVNVRQRLADHLNNCVTDMQHHKQHNHHQPMVPTPHTFSQFGSHHKIEPSFMYPQSLLPDDLNNNNNTTGGGGIMVNGVQLVPSRLPTGEIALIMPNSVNMSLNNLVNSPVISSLHSGFRPNYKSTPNNGSLVATDKTGYDSIELTQTRLSAFNPIGVNRKPFSSNETGCRHANSPLNSPASSISNSDFDSQPSLDAFALGNPNSTVGTTTPPLSTSDAHYNSTSSMNISSLNTSPPSPLANHTVRKLQQPQVSSTSDHHQQQQHIETAAGIVAMKRSFAFMEETFDRSSTSPLSATTTDSSGGGTVDDHPPDKCGGAKRAYDEAEHMNRLQNGPAGMDANGDMWRPW